MSENFSDLYYHPSFHDDHLTAAAGNSYMQNPSDLSAQNKAIDQPNISFNDFMHGSSNISALSGLGFSTNPEESKLVVDSGGEPPVTPKSSISSSSNEAEGSNKSKRNDDQEGEDNSSKKADQTKSKKKAEKKLEKEPRFSFLTKSEVDHLEDGYRWRKYGQKAVKNSAYPRSYYRCTTQKCLVKKRIERSFDDPSIVITTYEGQHNHHLPANLRGNMSGILSPSMPLTFEGSNNFPQQLLVQMPNLYSYGGGGSTSNFYHHQQTITSTPQYQQFTSDYGLLQDIIPPVLPKREP